MDGSAGSGEDGGGVSVDCDEETGTVEGVWTGVDDDDAGIEEIVCDGTGDGAKVKDAVEDAEDAASAGLDEDGFAVVSDVEAGAEEVASAECNEDDVVVSASCAGEVGVGEAASAGFAEDTEDATSAGLADVEEAASAGLAEVEASTGFADDVEEAASAGFAEVEDATSPGLAEDGFAVVSAGLNEAEVEASADPVEVTSAVACEEDSAAREEDARMLEDGSIGRIELDEVEVDSNIWEEGCFDA